MSKAEERGKTYALHKASEKLHDYYGNAMLSVVQFDGYDIKNAYIDGYYQAEKDLELTWEALRNQAAIAAMQGMLSNSFDHELMTPDNVAKQSVKYADALIEELRKSDT